MKDRLEWKGVQDAIKKSMEMHSLGTTVHTLRHPELGGSARGYNTLEKRGKYTHTNGPKEDAIR